MTPPDSTWSGLLYPVVAHWFPNIPKAILLPLLGLLISLVYAGYRKWRPLDEPKTAAGRENAPPNPIHVAIPAVVGGLIAGVPGLLASAMGDGLRRAGHAVLGWLGKRIHK